jgi:Transposase DDE domain
MAKRKSSRTVPQAQHGSRSRGSRHDKRSRLKQRDPQRERTTEAKVPLVGALAEAALGMSRLLDARIAYRLPIVIAGMLLAMGRRTASRWFQCAGVKQDWDRFYELLASLGRATSSLMLPLLVRIVRRFDPGPNGRWKLALDDSPTQRYGRHVEGANVHHNPTPGPANQTWLYGHNWVCLAFLLTHPLWGVLALPVLSRLYVRQENVAKLRARYGKWKFQTKHTLALDLVREVIGRVRALGSQAGWIIVVDGAYAARKLLRALLADGVQVISRLRRDAQLFDLPTRRQGRGRPRIYGSNRLSLIKRAGQSRGWQTITFLCRGVEITRRCKTFLATTRLTGGAVRVVLLEHSRGNWAAYFSTDQTMDAKAILEIGAQRWAIEETFHDVKEVWGAGQQQVRNVWSSIGCWHLNTWLYSLVELTCWDRPAAELVDRSDRSWDNPDRRPSHTDRRRQIRREMLEQQFLAHLPPDLKQPKFLARVHQLLALAT